MAKGKGNTLIDPRYCCLAVPMVNAGIYAILTEQLAVAVAAGVLSFTAPAVVGAAIPTFVTYIFGIVCFVGVAVQPIGFFGVFREKTTTFRIYSALNAIITILAFIVAAVIIIISGIRHQKAWDNCKGAYFNHPPNTAQSAIDTLKQEADILCKAFGYADLGFMGGLWVLLFFVQFYFVWRTRTYSVVQVKDHKLYHSVYSENPEAFTMSILGSRRYNPDSVMFTNSMYGGQHPAHRDDQAWNHRPSYDQPGPENGGGYYNHQRGYPEEELRDGHNDFSQHPEDGYAFTAPGGGYVESPHTSPKDGQHVHYSSGPHPSHH